MAAEAQGWRVSFELSGVARHDVMDHLFSLQMGFELENNNFCSADSGYLENVQLYVL